jgi:uncharacterized metal-binding protein YceD (DUF177 family)
MKVHLNQIPVEGLHIEGTEGNQILDLHDESIHPVGDVRYAIDVGVSDGGLFATGTVGVDLEMECVACLERFLYPLEIPDFACQVELTGREAVDLTDMVREDILLALPPHPRCDWNGRRVCQGASLRAKTETATEPLSDPRQAWGALDQLKIKKTN